MTEKEIAAFLLRKYMDRADAWLQTMSLQQIEAEVSDLARELARELQWQESITRQVRILRLYEFSGSREQVERQVEMSVHGTKDLRNGIRIRAVTLGEFPEIMQPTEGKESES